MSGNKIVFNPFTGKFDYVGSTTVVSTLTIQSVLSSILLDKDEQALPGTAQIQILFDEDTLLFSDDGAL